MRLAPFAAALAAGSLLAATPALADDLGYDNLTAAGWEGFESYLAAEPPKAFAVSPDGAWGWMRGADLAEAMQAAVRSCQAYAEADCQVVSANRELLVGFDVDGAPATMTVAEAFDAPGWQAFQTFLAADGNRAFAVGQDGAWGWQANPEMSIDRVQQAAVANCAQTGTGCAIAATIQVD